jgi:hypothetical protein
MRNVTLAVSALAALSCGGDDSWPSSPREAYTIDFEIVGQVTSDVQGQPLEGCRVWVDEIVGFGLGPTVAETFSDRDGRYVLHFSMAYDQPNCGWGDYPEHEDRVNFRVHADSPVGDTIHRSATFHPVHSPGGNTPGVNGSVTCASGAHTVDFALGRRE